ncbi:MAG: SDR family oxidoreductase [Prevotellaceae bacterium]|nr:SDR family oxidoreductase [Prevotellaceae bacterium]
MKKIAIITGADGCMGSEIARAVAMKGYHVIMASKNIERARLKRQWIIDESGNSDVEIMPIDLASLATVKEFAENILKREEPVALLMNNSGILEQEGRTITVDGIERTVSVNYVGHYLLTRLLIPKMERGSRIVSMTSLTYKWGRIFFPSFFETGCRGFFWRIFPYSNSKLAITLFTLKLARQLKDKGITVNCADPGVVATDIIYFKMWFDCLTRALFVPVIRTPRQGAATAIRLLLSPEVEGQTGTFNISCHEKKLKKKYLQHPLIDPLWEKTEDVVRKFL